MTDMRKEQSSTGMQCASSQSEGTSVAERHPFVDGNKRVAFQAMYVFLGLNGFRIMAPEEDVIGLMLELAAGELDKAELADWLRENAIIRE